MPTTNRILNGKLNLDVDNYALPPGDYLDALNITRDSKGQNQDKVVANVPGNTLISYTLPAGTNKCIGSFADLVRNRIYYYVWNSAGNHSWLYYDGASNTITKLIEDLTDTGGEAVLDFDPSKRINHIDVINRDEEGDLVFWTDGNTTPKCANVTRILNAEYSVIKSSFIETAKKPFLSAPTCAYGTDTSRESNSLRRTLFQFSARPVYDDFQKATLSTYSKVPLPVGYYGSDNDTETTANNFITVTIETGDEDVAKLEIYMRYNTGNTWSDFLLVGAIDKEQFSVPDNSTYSFLFYNDGVYPTLEVSDAIRLYDYVPLLADAQVMGNGTTPVYGSITEGYNPYPQGQLDVVITAANVTNVPPDTNPPTLVYTSNGVTWTFTVGGIIPTGTVFKIIANVPGSGVVVFADYTSLVGDTDIIVSSALWTYINTHYPGYPDGAPVGAIFYVKPPVPGFSVLGIQVDVLPVGGTIQTEKTWLWSANYIFGLVYVDEQNRDMPGVTNFISNTNTDNDFSVTTPSFSLVGTDVQTPVISASINHLPPEGAVKYYWVRRRQTYDTFLFYETCDFQEEDGYYYLCLGNIAGYKENNSQFKYGSIPVSSESRVKVIAGVTTHAYDGDIWTQDYQVVGVVTRTMTGGVSPDDDRQFVKIKKPSSAPSPAYKANMLIMLYTPIAPPVTDTDSVYYEWGEAYDIYESGGVKYHRGKDQDQTASQAAEFTWEEGDVYFHQRTMYRSKTFDDDPFNNDTLNIMDAGFSDFFESSVNDNGRAQIIDVNAKRRYNPVLVRFGGAFESGSNINNVNRFDFLNFDEYDRGRGAIRKLFLDKRRMVVFQQFDVGVVPVFTQIIKDTSGNPLEANSDQLLNKINYPYIGKFGIGDLPESFAYGKGAMYFADNNKGVICRLSADGVTPISTLYMCSAFFIPTLASFGNNLDNGVPAEGETYTGNPSVYGVFDSYLDKYVVALEEINRYSDINSFIGYRVDSGLNDDVYFYGTIVPEVDVKLVMQAANGDDQSVTYTTVEGDTISTVIASLISLANALPAGLFTASNVSNTTPIGSIPLPAGITLDGIEVSNVAGFDVTAFLVVTPRLVFHQDPYTLSFNEVRNSTEGFESFLSYHPENMVALNNLLITFKDGAFWRHDDPAFNNFYGVAYDSSISVCFNDNINLKKVFERVAYQANQKWVSEDDVDIYTSLVNPQTGLVQKSLLRDFDYIVDEGGYFASFLRDINSKSVALEGLYNGDYLTGYFIVVRFKCSSDEYAFINLPHVGWHLSQKNS